MQTTHIEYFDGQQKLIGELIGDQQQQGEQPVVIVFPAFEGRGNFALEYGKKIAANGCLAFVADMYGDAKTSHTLEGCFELITPFLQDRALTRRRAQLAYQTVLQQKHIDKNRIGAIGFCFGGMCALEIARAGENLRAVVSAHGILAKSDLITHAIKSKILILHGYQDPQVPPPMLQQFAQEMAAAKVTDWTFTFFGNAQHSFTDPATGTFDAKREVEMGRAYEPLAAARTWRYAHDFFQEHLKA